MTTDYQKRRQAFMQLMGPDSIFILKSAPVCERNGDYDYPYRQKSDFYYLTGFEEPDSVVVLAPKRKEGEFILFNRPNDRAEEIWTGHRAGQEGAKKQFGADQAFSIEELTEKLPTLLAGRKTIHYSLGVDKAFDKTLLATLEAIRGKIRNGMEAPITFVDITTSLHEMRLIKSPVEIDLMKKAAKITADAHIRAMKYCAPGRKEYELEAEILHEFQRNGARHAAYSSIVGSGANTCILHYTNNDQVIKKGDLVLIDAGCEYHNYAADVTRTFPADGHFTKEQRVIYDIVLKAQLEGIQAIKPGVRFDEIQTIIVKIITQGLMDVGILKGKLDTLIQENAYDNFYMHKSGHWLGLDVHDVGRYKTNGQWRQLEPGMVLTVEPGIYLSADIPGLATQWHHIGVRIEDDVLVTNTGHEVLTDSIPKAIPDIEALMSQS